MTLDVYADLFDDDLDSVVCGAECGARHGGQSVMACVVRMLVALRMRSVRRVGEKCGGATLARLLDARGLRGVDLSGAG